jgi:hypothetical protein
VIDAEIIRDPDGDVQHIAEHRIEVEEMLRSPATRTGKIRTSGRPQAFRWTSCDKFITVI